MSNDPGATMLDEKTIERAALVLMRSQKASFEFQATAVLAAVGYAELVEAAKALADKTDATSDCDHKRATCEEVGCVGAQVRAVRAALAPK